MANQEALGLVNQIQQLLSSTKDEISQRELRKQACEVSYRLFRELEEPRDLAMRTLHQPGEIPILRLARDLDIISQLLQAEEPLTSAKIAQRSGADPAIVTRVLRYLAAHGHIDEKGVDLFKANKSTKAFAMPMVVGWLDVGPDIVIPSWNAMPPFLKSKEYQTPTDPLDSPIQYAFNSKKHFFGILVERKMLSAFQTFIGDYRSDGADIFDVFPMDDRIIKGFELSSENEVLFVDVGGGKGHEVRKLVERFPQAKGRKILQELPNVVRDSDPSVESMEYDFFVPQPIKGARCYHFSRIFHDWPDARCLEILANAAAAMKPGYSKLLIRDVVLPDRGAAPYSTVSDFVMMILLAATERSEAQWRGLLERAGLKVVKIWPGEPESVIEAELI